MTVKKSTSSTMVLDNFRQHILEGHEKIASGCRMCVCVCVCVKTNVRKNFIGQFVCFERFFLSSRISQIDFFFDWMKRKLFFQRLYIYIRGKKIRILTFG